MHIPDGSPVDYHNKDAKRRNLYAWGWLGNSVPKSKNELAQDIIEKIKYAQAVEYCMGEHICEICNNYHFNGSIKILHDSKLYICPSGVHHYIEEHNYCPPPEVIEALKNGKILSEQETIQYDKEDIEYQKYLSTRKRRILKKESAEEEEMKKSLKEAMDRVNKMSPQKLAKKLQSVFLTKRES